MAQLAVAVLSGVALLLLLAHRFAPWLPLVLSFPLALLLTLPLVNFLIPVQGALVWLASRGQWHDHKAGRLDLLVRQLLPRLDVLCVQELFSGVFDARYRDRIIRLARQKGFHYSVSCPRIPRWPSMMLNQGWPKATDSRDSCSLAAFLIRCSPLCSLLPFSPSGTLILSRYPILASRTLVFRHRALYDVFTVNRGANWARIELPNRHVLHVFTCHIAPPLVEVAGRVGSLLHYCSCAQQAQLDELLAFMHECVSVDQNTDGSASRPFDVVLAGDFNLDCGSRRYFALLHGLQSLQPGRPMRDLFATEAEAEAQHIAQVLTAQTANDNEGAAGKAEKGQPAASVALRHRHGNANGKSPPSMSAVASYPSPRQQSKSNLTLGTPPMPFRVSHNRWHPSHGNAREEFDAASLQSFASVLPPAGRALEWAPTFGQRVRSRSDDACERCLETFLTHPSLLGSHSTHDFMFASCDAQSVEVDPVLAPSAQESDRLQRHAGSSSSDPDATLDGQRMPRCKPLPRPAPPFTQLSDHSALIATLNLHSQPTAASNPSTNGRPS